LRKDLAQSYDLEQAGVVANLAAYTIRKAVISEKLPAYKISYDGFRGGELPWRINGYDLRWYLENHQPKVGRPKKKITLSHLLKNNLLLARQKKNQPINLI
jgi:hypothetical protein